MPTSPTSPLPTAETCARVALACAGLSGNPAIGRALRTHTAVELVAAAWDHSPSPLAQDLAGRLRQLARPDRVAAAIDTTRELGLRILGPESEHWPAGLSDLGAGAPLLLWVSGNPQLLDDAAIVLTGSATPSLDIRRMVIDIATRLADQGWTLAATTRPGVDQLTRDAALAMNGWLVTVGATPAMFTDPGEVVVSENPPDSDLVFASTVRAPILLAAMARKIILGEPRRGTGAARTGLAAHALGRPLGILEGGGDVPGGRDLRERLDARPVRTSVQVERLR